MKIPRHLAWFLKCVLMCTVVSLIGSGTTHAQVTLGDAVTVWAMEGIPTVYRTSTATRVLWVDLGIYPSTPMSVGPVSRLRTPTNSPSARALQTGLFLSSPTLPRRASCGLPPEAR